MPLGTVIQNFCDIYFDFNDPVRTNTAGTKVVFFIPGEGLVSQAAMRLRPNPAAISTTVDWKKPAPANGRLRFFDITGLPRLEYPVAYGQQSMSVNIGILPAGLYFVLLEAGNLVLSNKLIVLPLVPVGGN